jgi:hypothetical protein
VLGVDHLAAANERLDATVMRLDVRHAGLYRR